jgi:PhzF family phenazine biosynthesis protein
VKSIPLYHVDAFATEAFRGNPAAVCPLDAWLEDDTMQSIAAENNLSETAFFVPDREGYHLRWFSPAREIDLCGHATLASAFVLFERLKRDGDSVTFQSRSGPLVVRRDGDRLALDFPVRPAVRDEAPRELIAALGVTPLETWRSRDWMAVLGSEDEVRALAPSIEKLKAIDAHAFIVTAPGRDADFVSRFFAPSVGVPEDPVTGSAHCTLVPYWSERLGKTRLRALQVSRRGGELHCELRGDRVIIAGRAVLFMEGTIRLSME